MKATELIISRQDLGRLDVLLGGTSRGQMGKVRDFLLDELARARVVEDSDVPTTVVTMHSTVEFRDDDTGHRMVARLVYPHEVAGREHALYGGLSGGICARDAAVFTFATTRSTSCTTPGSTFPTTRANRPSPCCRPGSPIASTSAPR